MSSGRRALSRKEQEELKKKEDEEAAAHAFQEFVETFQEPVNKTSKVWVKAGTYDAGSRKEDNRDKGKLYKPTSKLEERSSQRSSSSSAMDYARSELSREENNRLKKRSQEKKKSNLELFKEELRQIQEEREERHKYKSVARSMIANTESESPVTKESDVGSFDNGDPNTTNLYLGNLCPKISEQQLMELFGKYGPLASIKIMWPRSEEEKSRGRNCGFVAYMSRKDAERALKHLNGRFVMGYEMKLGWGKSVPIMSHPIYIPPALVAYSLPSASGLPFNAQPPTTEVDEEDLKNYMAEAEARTQVDHVLQKSLIKVVIPTERGQLALIHRMIEFVIREGPIFEAMIMNREMDNPAFRFLFDNKCAAHIYYRWKLFSLLQGDTISDWRHREFRMFENGSVWKPPVANIYSLGMPDELVVDDSDAADHTKGALSVAQRDRLEDLIRHLTPDRQKIGDAMIFCIEHADAADEICECIAQSMENVQTMMQKKIARLFLVSDILHNCSVKVQNASFFRKSLEQNLVSIFSNLNTCYMSIESRIKAEGFKARVMQVFRAWEDWAVYPRDFLARLKHIFLGLPTSDARHDDVDGAPLSGDEKDDEDLDGTPLDGAALLKSAMLRGLTEKAPVSQPPGRSGGGYRRGGDDDDDDIDGVPLNDDDEEDIDGIPLDGGSKSGSSKPAAASSGFIPSKWETVAPDQVEAQAVTSSKWERVVQGARRDRGNDRDDDDGDSDDSSSPMMGPSEYDEEKRSKLREVELRTIQYQDELESGEREVKDGWTMSRQLEHYRRKLMKKSLAELQDQSGERGRERRRSSTPSDRRSKRGTSPSSPYGKRVRYDSSDSRSRSPDKMSRKYRSPSPRRKSPSQRSKRSPPSRTRTEKSKYK